MSDATISRRRIELDGARNFRDLGGYPSLLGGTTRWGRIFRSDRLDTLTLGDLDVLTELGVVTVYDLRTDEERDRAPDPIPSVHIPILSRFMASRPIPDFGALVEHDQGVRFMSDMMIGLLTHAGPEIGQILTGFADPATTPAVFHCTAGKDRTGLIAALLLEWLGVDRDTVIDDFVLTEQFHVLDEDHHAFRRMLERGIGPEAAAGALGAPRSMMAETLHELDTTFGGVETYLTDQAGIGRQVLEDLREHLLG